MTKPSLKIEKYKLARIFIWLILILAAAYEIYFLYGVRVKINDQEPPDHPVHVIKVDQNNLGLATKRYTGAQTYTFGLPTLHDPFALKIDQKLPGQ